MRTFNRNFGATSLALALSLVTATMGCNRKGAEAPGNGPDDATEVASSDLKAGADTDYRYDDEEVSDTSGIAIDATNKIIWVATQDGGSVGNPAVVGLQEGGGAPIILENVPGAGPGSAITNPSDVAVSANGDLFVSDQSNNRILVYFAPFREVANDIVPDAVLGQTDTNLDGSVFDEIQINQGNTDASPAVVDGIADPAGNTLYAPTGLHFSGAIANGAGSGVLWVADSGNNRVLRYNLTFSGFGISGGAAASLVLGQADMTARAPAMAATASNLDLCDSNADGSCDDFAGDVWVASNGDVHVADTWQHRVIRYSAPFANGGAAASALGQSSLTASLANQGGANPTASTLSAPVSVASDTDGNIYVADRDNNRVLAYFPLTTNAADDVYGIGDANGQPIFSSAVNADITASIDELLAPRAVMVDPVDNTPGNESGGNLYVSADQTPALPPHLVRFLVNQRPNLNLSGMVTGGGLQPAAAPTPGCQLASGNLTCVAYELQAVTVTLGSEDRGTETTTHEVVKSGDALAGEQFGAAFPNPCTATDAADLVSVNCSYVATLGTAQALNDPSVLVDFALTDDGNPQLGRARTATISVQNQNQAPTLAITGTTTVAEGGNLLLTLAGSDAADSPATAVTYSGPFSDAGCSIVATGVPGLAVSGASATWTPGFDQVGNVNGVYPVYFAATDAGSTGGVADPRSACTPTTITVTPTNRKPVVANPGNRTIGEGQLLSFLVTTTDPDGDPIADFLKVGPTGTQLVWTSGNYAEFRWTPSASQVGIHTISFQSRDNGDSGPTLFSDAADITVTVTNVNNAPNQPTFAANDAGGPGPDDNTCATIGDDAGDDACVVAVAGDLVHMKVSATDPDGTTPTLTPAGLPLGSTFNASTGDFSWTTQAGQAGFTFAVTFTAADGTLSASRTLVASVANGTPVTLTVESDAVCDGAGVVTSSSINEGATLSLWLCATDAGATFTENGVGTLSGNAFTYTPSASEAGPRSVTFTAAAGGQTDSIVFPITVTNSNTAPNRPTLTVVTGACNDANDPELDGTNDTQIDACTVAEGGSLQITVNATDPDADQADRLSFSIASPGISAGSTVELVQGSLPSNPASATVNFTAGFDQAGTQVDITVSSIDASGLPTAAETIRVTTTAVNRAPVLTVTEQSAGVCDVSVESCSIDEGENIDLDIAAIDPDAGQATSLTCTGTLCAKLGLAIAPTVITLPQPTSWTPSSTESGSYSATLTLRDDQAPALQAQKMISVTVAEFNQAPALTTSNGDIFVGGIRTPCAPGMGAVDYVCTIDEGASVVVGASAADADATAAQDPDGIADKVSIQLFASSLPGTDGAAVFTADTNGNTIENPEWASFAFTAGQNQSNDCKSTAPCSTTFRATDDHSNGAKSDDLRIDWVVNRVNNAPVITLVDQTACFTLGADLVCEVPPVGGSNLVLTFTALDADAPKDSIGTMSASGPALGPLPAGCSVSSNPTGSATAPDLDGDRATDGRLVITCTAGGGDAGPVNTANIYTVDATDVGSPSPATGTFDLKIVSVDANVAPEFNAFLQCSNVNPLVDSIPDCLIPVGSSLTAITGATDHDLDALTYAGADPAGACGGAGNLCPDELEGDSFNPATQTYQYVATALDVNLATPDMSYDLDGDPATPATEAILLTFTVSDGNGGADTLQFFVGSVDNAAPAIAPITDKTVAEGQNVAFTVTATDADATDTATLAVSGTLPAGATFTPGAAGNPTTGSFSWTPGFVQAGVYNVSFVGTDNKNLDGAVETVQITVTDVNLAPVLAAIGPQSVNEGVALSIPISCNDPDANLVSLSAAPLPTGAGFVDNFNGTGSFTWTPGFTQSGNYNVLFGCSDSQLVDSENITITVNNVNRAPVLDAVGDRSVSENAMLSIDLSGSDADGDTVTFTATGAPAGSSFNAATGLFTWTPSYDQVTGAASNSVTVTFGATDGTSTDGELITITINNVNRAPSLDPIGDKSVNENAALSFTVSAADADMGETVTLSVMNAPTGSTFNAATGAFSWTPSYTDAGTHSVTFRATDNGLPMALTAQELITITVVNVNRAPVLGAVVDATGAENAAITFSVSATDADADSISLSATGLPAGATFNGVTGGFAWTPSYEQAGTYTVSFVADDGVATDSADAVITVTNTNRAPELVAIAPISAVEGETVATTIVATDADGDTLTYSATGLPTGASLDASTGILTWETDKSSAGEYDITVTVADDGTPASLSDSATVTITIDNKGGGKGGACSVTGTGTTGSAPAGLAFLLLPIGMLFAMRRRKV